jgi:hypothetical protein
MLQLFEAELEAYNTIGHARHAQMLYVWCFEAVVFL